MDLDLINDALLTPLYKGRAFKRSEEQETALDTLISEYLGYK